MTFHLVCFGFLLFSGHIGPTFGTFRRHLPVYEGFHEMANDEETSGWAWDSTRLDVPVEHVDIYDGDTLLAVVSADEFRAGLLEAAARGNGKHHFSYMILAVEGWTPSHHQRCCRFSGTAQGLQDTPRTIIGSINVESVGGQEGFHDQATCDQVTGWAWDSSRPDVSIDVDIYDGDTLLAVVPADQFRAGLVAAAWAMASTASPIPSPRG